MTHPLHEQVVVITGASSGIGRETALRFAKAGAKVVLGARNAAALQDVASEIHDHGGQALGITTDISDWDAAQRLAQEAMDSFGRIDIWVNDAGVTVYGLVEEVPIEEFEKVINVNLLGTIYGVKAALPHMRKQGFGTIINIGSVLSTRSIPLQSAYCASKFGVRGFTDALRMELMREKANINVTLILPSSMNTPLFEHARSHMDSEPMPIPPVYDPSEVADAIVHAAAHPSRDVYVGGAGKMFALMERVSPSLTDRVMLVRGWMFKSQKDKQPNDEFDTLDMPAQETGEVRGRFGDMTKPSFVSRFWGLFALPAMLLGSIILIKRRQE
jgi:NAD(P)-dependent dehydrogenase (short-subunit alcohol dehydrogenase family)